MLHHQVDPKPIFNSCCDSFVGLTKVDICVSGERMLPITMQVGLSIHFQGVKGFHELCAIGRQSNQ